MSWHTPRAMRSSIPQRVREKRSLHDLADPSRRLRNSSSIPSLQYRPFVWRGAENDAKHWNVWSTRSLLLQPEAWQTTGHGSTAVRLHRHPSIDALQTGVSIERHFSRIFPAHPRSLARCLSRARRHGASLLRTSCALRVSAFRKSFVQRTQKDFPNLPKKTPLGLGSGAHSRRFAQECPEGNPGKYNQGEKQWRSTKTRSL